MDDDAMDAELDLEAELEAELEREAAGLAETALYPEELEAEAVDPPAMHPEDGESDANAPRPINDNNDDPLQEVDDAEDAGVDDSYGAEQPQEQREIVRSFAVTLEDGCTAQMNLLAPRKRSMDTMPAGGLLAQPIALLRDELDRETASNRAAGIPGGLEGNAGSAEAANDDTPNRAAASGGEAATEHGAVAGSRQSKLWVDKYADMHPLCPSLHRCRSSSARALWRR